MEIHVYIHIHIDVRVVVVVLSSSLVSSSTEATLGLFLFKFVVQIVERLVVTNTTVTMVGQMCATMEALRVDRHLRTKSVQEVGRCFVGVHLPVLGSLMCCFTFSGVSCWLLALPRHFIEV